MHRKHMCSPGGLSSQPPLGPLRLNSWLVSSLSLFSTNLTNYLISQHHACAPTRSTGLLPILLARRRQQGREQ